MKMNATLKMAVIAIVAVAVAKKLPVTRDYV